MGYDDGDGKHIAHQVHIGIIGTGNGRGVTVIGTPLFMILHF